MMKSEVASRRINRLAVGLALLFVLGCRFNSCGEAPSHIAGPGSPSRWTQPIVRFQLDSASIPAELGADAALSALRAAAYAWSKPACGEVSIQVEPSDKAPGAGQHHVNLIAFQQHWWCKRGIKRSGNCYDPRIAAITTTRPTGQDRGAGKRLIEGADVELNAVDFHWTVEPQSQAQDARTLDLQSVLTHEFGHALGFSHVCGLRRSQALPLCALAPAHLRNSVMMPAAYEVGVSGPWLRRSLSDDDVRALCERYPALP